MARHNGNGRRQLISLLLSAATVLFAAGCTGATDPGGTLALHRARWQARGIASYRFDFHQTGFFITCTGPLVRLHVTAGVIDAATDQSTGQPLPVNGCWPTIDQLFDRAAQAEQVGSLTSIDYDPTLDYPTRIEFAGPPDASGSDFVSNLQPTP